MSYDKAVYILKEMSILDENNIEIERNKRLPLNSIHALESIILSFTHNLQYKQFLLKKLDQSLFEIKLNFTVMNQNKSLTKERVEYLERIEKLKLRKEERKYCKLTKNVNFCKKNMNNDITQNMKYVTSIGMNMIIAPISFGVFIFYVPELVFRNDKNVTDNKTNRISITRILLSVISGVIILFIEMILFIIRNHQMDYCIRKNKDAKEKNTNCFGYHAKNNIKTFCG